MKFRFYIFSMIVALFLFLYAGSGKISAVEPPEYVLAERNGYIAVLDGTSGALLCCTETPVSALPPADAALIRCGFSCEDDIALAKALENFCS